MGIATSKAATVEAKPETPGARCSIVAPPASIVPNASITPQTVPRRPKGAPETIVANQYIFDS